MEGIRLVLYGKGGVGKSTIAVHLSAAYAEKGLKVLHVGCDPKMDSSIRLSNREDFPCLVDFIEDRSLGRRRPEDLIVVGKWGIHTIETGGPEPGKGCAGRGVATLFDFLDRHAFRHQDYDVMLFDVVGDLVCGGFVAPLRFGIGNSVIIVASGELMSLYAANNVARVVLHHVDDSVTLAGIVFNLHSEREHTRQELVKFAGRINARVLGFIPWDEDIRVAEKSNGTLFDAVPDSRSAERFRDLAEVLSKPVSTEHPLPTPLGRREFMQFVRSLDL